MPNIPRCGAKKRNGQPCKTFAMPNGRCRLHGGKSTGPPKGSQNALKHGIYAKGLTEEECLLWNDMKLGNVDDEIKLCRIRLRRALIALKEIDENKNDVNVGFTLTEIKQSTNGQQNSREVIRKRENYHYIIDRLTARIAQLEKTRKQLLEDISDPETDFDGFEFVEYDNEDITGEGVDSSTATDL